MSTVRVMVSMDAVENELKANMRVCVCVCVDPDKDLEIEGLKKGLRRRRR
jgi:hypothetical protein